MDQATTSPGPGSRPYRSHKVPACDLCRQRKAACKIDIPGQACRLCRERSSSCHFTKKHGSRTHADGTSAGPSQPSTHVRPHRRPGKRASLQLQQTIDDCSPTESTMLMNPPMAEDIEVLEQYLGGNAANDLSPSKPYRIMSSTPGNPIVYLTVPRHRKGHMTSSRPGLNQQEIIEQVLDPLKETVVDVYFEKLHPCFPVLDDVVFHKMWHKDAAAISAAVLCDIYAAALHFWNSSEQLKQHPRPDLAFIWNQAVAALHEDLLGSSISTICASLLDLIGRPVISMTGNVGTMGRTVALAYSMGLHRDPSAWNAKESEQRARIHLWWGVLIHDQWSSLAHGTPPLIQAQNYDVPLPSCHEACPSGAQLRSGQNDTFTQLCRLTKILGNLLLLVYDLNLNPGEVMRQIRRLECTHDDWESDLPCHLRAGTFVSGHVNGASNLQFCFLSTKLLMCRVAVKATTHKGATMSSEAQAFRLASMRDAASQLADFVCSLSTTQLREFWLPYTAHLLVSATTILLRCLLESKDITTKQKCAQQLIRLRNHLQKASDEHSWDLADFCLERCSEPIAKIAAAMGVPTNSSSESETLITGPHELDSGSASLETLLPIDLDDFTIDNDLFDYPFDTPWSSLV